MVNRRLWFRGAVTPRRPMFDHVRTALPGTASLGLDTDVEPELQGADAGDVPPGGRLLFINQYYWPDHASTAQHLTDLVESLAARGFECHVLCSRGSYKPGQPAPPADEVHNGVHIHRVQATSLGRRSSLTRYADYLSFYARAVLTALRMPRFDGVVTLTTPPIIGLIGTLLRRFRGTPHIYWSMDLHPDASLALRLMSRRNPIVRALAWLSDAVYRQADRVVVLGPYMADRILVKGVRPDRIETIPVWSRRDEIYPVDRAQNPLRRSLGLGDRFVAMYSGNLGLAHSFDEFLNAARQLRDRQDIVFLFVGGGPRVREVRDAIERDQLENVKLLDYFPRDQLHHSLSVADVHLISMRPEMRGIVVPGKLYGVMAAARPTIFVGPAHCESADTIRRSGCGFTIAPGDAESVIDSLTKLAGDLNLAHQMGQKGRISFLAAHESSLCCHQWQKLIRTTVGRAQPHRNSQTSPAFAHQLGTVLMPAGSLEHRPR